jgi:hypothetical protein
VPRWTLTSRAIKPSPHAISQVMLDFVAGRKETGGRLSVLSPRRWEISAEEVQMTTGPERERTFLSAGDELRSKLWEMTKGPTVLGIPRTGVKPMAPSRSNGAIEPMTLGQMRNGVHSLLIACQKCGHEVVMTANASAAG